MLVWKPEDQSQQILSFVVGLKLVDAHAPPSSKEGVNKWGLGKKPATFHPSQIQDLLRWSKAVGRLSTQKYIAKCVYIFFCICKDVSVKHSIVIEILCHLRLLE